MFNALCSGSSGPALSLGENLSVFPSLSPCAHSQSRAAVAQGVAVCPRIPPPLPLPPTWRPGPGSSWQNHRAGSVRREGLSAWQEGCSGPPACGPGRGYFWFIRAYVDTLKPFLKADIFAFKKGHTKIVTRSCADRPASIQSFSIFCGSPFPGVGIGAGVREGEPSGRPADKGRPSFLDPLGALREGCLSPRPQPARALRGLRLEGLLCHPLVSSAQSQFLCKIETFVFCWKPRGRFLHVVHVLNLQTFCE